MGCSLGCFSFFALICIVQSGIESGAIVAVVSIRVSSGSCRSAGDAEDLRWRPRLLHCYQVPRWHRSCWCEGHILEQGFRSQKSPGNISCCSTPIHQKNSSSCSNRLGEQLFQTLSRKKKILEIVNGKREYKMF